MRSTPCMIHSVQASAPLDDFLKAPAIMRKTLTRPSAMRRWVYTLVLLTAMLLAIIGLIDVNMVLGGEHRDSHRHDAAGGRPGHPGGGRHAAASLRIAGGVCDAGVATGLCMAHPVWLARHRLAGDRFCGDQASHALWWTRGVHESRSARMHFGWIENDAGLAGPLELVPSHQAKSLLRTTVEYTGLIRHDAGVWVRRGSSPAAVNTGMMPW